MPVFGAKMAWCVPINIFRVDICTHHKYSLDHAQVSPYTCNMERSPKVPRSCINLASILHEQLN